MIIESNAQEVKTQVLAVPDEARMLDIVTTEDYHKASSMLLRIKELRIKVDASFDPIIKKAHEAHKEAVAQKKTIEAPLTEAESIIKPKIAVFLYAEEQKRKAEELRIQTELKKAEDERKLTEAIALEALGQINAMEEVLESSTVPVAVTLPTTQKVEGQSMREIWSAEVTNLQELVDYVSSHPDQLNFVLPNLTALNSLARSLKQWFNIPGVKVVCKRNIAQRVY